MSLSHNLLAHPLKRLLSFLLDMSVLFTLKHPISWMSYPYDILHTQDRLSREGRMDFFKTVICYHLLAWCAFCKYAIKASLGLVLAWRRLLLGTATWHQLFGLLGILLDFQGCAVDRRTVDPMPGLRRLPADGRRETNGHRAQRRDQESLYSLRLIES